MNSSDWPLVQRLLTSWRPACRLSRSDPHTCRTQFRYFFTWSDNYFFVTIIITSVKRRIQGISYLPERLQLLFKSPFTWSVRVNAASTLTLQINLWLQPILERPSFGVLVFYQQQECIPVGCVPANRGPYAGVCFPGGVLHPGGGVSIRGGFLHRGGSPSGGVPPSSRGGGSPSSRGVSLPDPPLWTEWQTGVKILPWPKLRFGR